jgi:GR25 family glycosyltransferase involved in LPS biosynthesis
MNKSNIYILLLILLLIASLFNWKFFWKNKEIFTKEINMYVISLKHNDRLENIKKQENKINEKIEIFDAVKGDTLDIQTLLKENIITDKYKNAEKTEKRVIGCYLSHLNLLKKIKETNSSEYTIIFEDDFNIVISNFSQEIQSIIRKMEKYDFDLLFLGNLEKNKGKHIIDNIYKMNPDQHLWGAQGYIVNNKNIDKIIEKVKIMDRPIDDKYEELGKNNQLNIFVLHPTIVNQGGFQGGLKSDIHDSVENYCNMNNYSFL